ncbi:MAG: PilN domain-containing protein [Sinobacterium sp.]
MPNINLLPWREELREELKKQFIIITVAVALVSIILVGLSWFVMRSNIEHQPIRNDYVQTERNRVSSQVQEIKQLKAKRAQMLERMRVIQNLQGNRPVIVNMFDELVRIVPDGVFFSKVSTEDDQVSITGTAESNNRVASLMRNIDRSAWFTAPSLTQVTANKDFGPRANDFAMSMVLSPPVMALPENEGER